MEDDSIRAGPSQETDVNEPMATIREVHAGDWRVRLDVGGQVLTLENDEYRRQPRELRPTLPHSEGGPVSAATLLLKAKQFDDGL
jgi:hypothetical protein